MSQQIISTIKQLNTSTVVRDTRSADHLSEIQQERRDSFEITHKVQFKWNGMKTNWIKGSMSFVQGLVDQVNSCSESQLANRYSWIKI